MEDIRKRYFICSRHFLPSDYKNAQSRSLNWNAVPKINLTCYDNRNGLDSSITPHQRVGCSVPPPEAPPTATVPEATTVVRHKLKVENRNKRILIPTGTPTKLLTKVQVMTCPSPPRLRTSPQKPQSLLKADNAKRKQPPIKNDSAESGMKRLNSITNTMFTSIDSDVHVQAITDEDDVIMNTQAQGELS